MAWRPNEQFVEGVLDNTVPGKVTGWMKFAGMKEKVVFDLEGNFHRDIRGAKVRLRGDGESADAAQAAKYMESFSTLQKGKVGDMTAGLPPADYVTYPYFEHYGDDNGRVVIELEPSQVEVIGRPIPPQESDPISRVEQARNMDNWLGELARTLQIPQERVISVGGPANAKQGKKKLREAGMQLMTEEIRKKLPALGSQDSLGGKAIVYVKYFTPDAGWTFYATEFDGRDTFFGLVDGTYKELGYFSLSELKSVRGPMNLPIERDLYWQPKKLEEIAFELFVPTKSSEE